MTEQSATIPSVWFHATDDLSWHHGPGGSKIKTHRREKPWDPFSRDVIHTYKYKASMTNNKKTIIS